MNHEQGHCPSHKPMDSIYKHHKTSVLSPHMSAMENHFSNILQIPFAFFVNPTHDDIKEINLQSSIDQVILSVQSNAPVIKVKCILISIPENGRTIT